MGGAIRARACGGALGRSCQRKSGNYDQAYDNAADEAEKLLGFVARDIMPKFLDFYPAAVWEDQDECLSVQPEDIEL